MEIELNQSERASILLALTRHLEKLEEAKITWEESNHEEAKELVSDLSAEIIVYKNLIIKIKN